MGKNVEAMLKEYSLTKNRNMLSDILYELGNSNLWMPVSDRITLENGEKFLNITDKEDSMIENNIHLTPGIVRSGQKRFIPVFLSKQDAPQYFRDSYSWRNITLNEVAKITLITNKMAGIVVNPFTSPFVITREFLVYRSSSINSYVIPKGTDVLYRELESNLESECFVSVIRKFADEDSLFKIQKIYLVLFKKNEEQSYLIIVDADSKEYEKLFRQMNSTVLSNIRLSYPIDYCPCSDHIIYELEVFHIRPVWSRI